MRIRFLIALLAALTIAPTAALAQFAVGGAVGGALAGGAIGGPAGAAVGAAIGATVGMASEFHLPPPPEPKRTGKAVAAANGIKVGQKLPLRIAIHPRPHEQYSYAVVNDTRVLVDPETRVVVKIVKQD